MSKILPDREIASLLGKAILNGSEDCVRVNSYEVRLGHKAHFDSTGEELEIPNGHYLEIDPGDFVTVESLEVLDFSKKTLEALGKANGLFAWITPTTTMMREGFLFASTKVDVGYKGSLNWGIRNSSIKTVRIFQGEKLFKLTICELENSEVPDRFYGENKQDHYQGTEGIRESARMIRADIPEKLLIRKTHRKVDPIKQLTQAGYPFNHIGTELIDIQGKFEIVSRDVALVKSGFDGLQNSLETKIENETTALSNEIGGMPDKIDSRIRNAFSEQFGLYFDQRMQRVYGTVITLVTFSGGLYKIISAATPLNMQGYVLLGMAGIFALATFALTTRNSRSTK